MTATRNKIHLGSWALFAGATLFASQAQAWSERGHHIICEVAARMVKEPALSTFLSSRVHMMGHLCNVPDIYWRNIDGTKDGDWTHHIDPERLDMKPLDVPTDFKAIVADWEGKSSNNLGRAVHVATDLGSSWWRAEQFQRRAIAAASSIPQGKDAVSEPDVRKPTAYDKAVMEFIVNMGLQGHFVGDNSMPYHVTDDYDGWKSGHGGIHSFYEGKCVDALALDLPLQVYNEAKKLKASFLKPGLGIVDRMKLLGIISYSEIEKLEKLDKLLSPSKGKEKAVRPMPSEAAPHFRKLIVAEMARSAALLALLWDEAYVAANRPDLTLYRNWAYPFTPAFVAPDYIQ